MLVFVLQFLNTNICCVRCDLEESTVRRGAYVSMYLLYFDRADSTCITMVAVS